MTTPPDQPFDEHDEIVGVTLVREDLRLLLVVASIHQMDLEEREGRRDARLQLAMDRIGPTATSAEWQPKRPFVAPAPPPPAGEAAGVVDAARGRAARRS